MQTLTPVATVHCGYAARGEGAPHDILRTLSDNDRLYAKTPGNTFRVALERPRGPAIERLEVMVRQKATVRHPAIFLAPIVTLYVNGSYHGEVPDHVIRVEGFHDWVYAFSDVGRATTLEVEVEAWAVGWLGDNGTTHEVSRVEARAFGPGPPSRR